MPSIILNAFIIPTTQKIVNGILKIPRFISPNPNKLPNDSKYTPVLIKSYKLKERFELKFLKLDLILLNHQLKIIIRSGIDITIN